MLRIIGKARTRVGLVGICVAGLAAAVGTAAALAVGGPPPGAPLSGFEATRGGLVAGDDGITVGLPNGKDLLLRGDTPFFGRYSGSYIKLSSIHGSTAAEAPYSPGIVSQNFAELPTPPQKPGSALAAPARFLPNPRDLEQPGKAKPCTGTNTNYGASWITGAVMDPATYSPSLGYDTDVLITYDEACVTGASVDGQIEGWGVAEYNWATNAFDSVTEVVTPGGNGAAVPAADQLGTPVIVGGEVYLFAPDCDESYYGVCVSGRVFVAQVADQLTSLQSSSAYHFFDTTTGAFTDDAARASSQSGSVVPDALGGPFGISVGDYGSVAGRHGQQFEMVVTTDVIGDYQLWQSPSPTGPWTMQSQSRIPGCDTEPSTGYCYALVGHPELSTAGDLVLSYLDPSYYRCDNSCTSSGYIQHLYDISIPWPS